MTRDRRPGAMWAGAVAFLAVTIGCCGGLAILLGGVRNPPTPPPPRPRTPVQVPYTTSGPHGPDRNIAPYLPVVRLFKRAVEAGEFDTAHGFLDAAFQARMSPEEFISHCESQPLDRLSPALEVQSGEFFHSSSERGWRRRTHGETTVTETFEMVEERPGIWRIQAWTILEQ